MFRKITFVLFIAIVAGILNGCASWDPERQSELERDVASTITKFKQQDPGMKRFFKEAYAYAVFPTVGKGAMGLGGAYGDGLVYRQGKLVGRTSLTQVTIGLQLGAQAYHEVIFFRDHTTFSHFKDGKLKFSGQLSAVAATAGASSDVAYEEGVAVFTLAQGGLMYEASVGGQGFSYEPIK